MRGVKGDHAGADTEGLRTQRGRYEDNRRRECPYQGKDLGGLL